jgi:hypothetical protein
MGIESEMIHDASAAGFKIPPLSEQAVQQLNFVART